MITVRLFNKMEIELIKPSVITEDYTTFRVKYYNKIVNLLDKNYRYLTKDDINLIVDPDFECNNFTYNSADDTLVINFNRKEKSK